jgi:murein DD-endopeptidase MepM/ murein hydrolase activator NlpD
MKRHIAPALLLLTFIALLVRPALAADELKITLSPKTAQQGDVVIIRVAAPKGATLTGVLADQPVGFVKDRAGKGPGYIGLSAVDPLRNPGAYAVVVSATLSNGEVLTAESRLTVRGGGFLTETVTITDSLKHTIDPAVSLAEEQEIRAVYAVFTPEQKWRGTFRTPLKGRTLSEYGNRRIYNGVDLGTYHAGVDFYGLRGRPVLAAAAGKIAAVREFKIHGNMIIIDHGRGVFTGYAHLSKTLVKPGDVVAAGAKIGEVGTTGRSQGNHLHFEIAIGGVRVEPSYWLQHALP